MGSSTIFDDVLRTFQERRPYREIVERLAETTRNDETGIFQDILQMMRELVRYLLRKQPELREWEMLWAEKYYHCHQISFEKKGKQECSRELA